MKPSVSVIGLGKLGAPLAVVFAVKGFKTLALDIHKPFVDAINEGRAPVVEPFLQEYLDRGKDNLKATQDWREAIEESDFTFLIVPTPSRPDHHFSDEHLKRALKELSLALKESKKPRHNFVIVATVSPGTIDKSLIPWIEQHSGRKVNKGFGVAYNPEFIALGDVINGLLRPDMVLVGESDREIGDRLEEVYKHILENDASIARMSLISAEIAKISLNAYVTMKISFANMLANICEKIPGADVDAITSALGADKRISPHYLKGGLPFGGPCFPRDSRAFVAFAADQGVDAKLAKATDDINKDQVRHLAEMVYASISKENNPLAEDNPVVAILGLAYKPNTPVIEESPSVLLAKELLASGIRLAVYDPLAMENARKELGDAVVYAAIPEDAIRGASCVVITTPDVAFQNLNLQAAALANRALVVIDCWRVLKNLSNKVAIRYLSIGQHPPL